MTATTISKSVMQSVREPIEIGKFFKNRKGDVIVVQIKEYEGFVFCDIRQFFQDDNGVSRPSKKGIAIGLHKLDDLAGLINKTIANGQTRCGCCARS